MTDLKRYARADYKGEFNLLDAQRELILKALIKAKGEKFLALAFLSPEKKHFFGFRTLGRQMEKHNITTRNMKRKLKAITAKREACKRERDSIKTKQVQKRLLALECKYEGLHLRSIVR